MSSKYIPNSRQHKKAVTYEWSSDHVDFSNIVEDNKEYYNNYKKEKERVEAIPLEQLTFRDLYQFPFRSAKYGSWVYDDNSNFIFQFEFKSDDTREKILRILNGEITEYKRREVRNSKGMLEVKIEDKWEEMILLRGWGSLTGVGAYNLEGKYAAKIQDTLADYIVEKLSV